MGAIKVIVKAGYLMAWLTSYFDEYKEIKRKQGARCAGNTGRVILQLRRNDK